MPRELSGNLEVLHKGNCVSESTLEIYLRSGAKYFLTTAAADLEIEGYEDPFLAGTLIRVGELDVTLGVATNRVSVKIANPDDLFSSMIPTKELELSEVVIKSYKRKEFDASFFAHGHFFSGVLVNPEAAETKVSTGEMQRSATFDVIPPEAAAGICLAMTTLTPANFGKFPGIQTVELPSGGGGIGGGDIGGGGGGGYGGGGYGGEGGVIREYNY